MHNKTTFSFPIPFVVPMFLLDTHRRWYKHREAQVGIFKRHTRCVILITHIIQHFHVRRDGSFHDHCQVRVQLEARVDIHVECFHHSDPCITTGGLKGSENILAWEAVRLILKTCASCCGDVKATLHMAHVQLQSKGRNTGTNNDRGPLVRPARCVRQVPTLALY